MLQCPAVPPAAVTSLCGDGGRGPLLTANKDVSPSCSSSYSHCILGLKYLPEPQKSKPVSNRISSGWQPSPASTCGLSVLFPSSAFCSYFSPFCFAWIQFLPLFLCSVGLRSSSYIFSSQLYILREVFIKSLLPWMLGPCPMHGLSYSPQLRLLSS